MLLSIFVVVSASLTFLGKLNRRHAEKHPGEHELEARIASYELAARMQDAALEALDISGETEAIISFTASTRKPRENMAHAA